MGSDKRIDQFHATCLVVGGVVGAGILYTAGQVYRSAGSETGALVGWCLGGIMALCGGLLTGECASRIPKNGGEYLYLSEGMGRPVGFLSGWSAFLVGYPGSIATLSMFISITLVHVLSINDFTFLGVSSTVLVALLIIGAVTILAHYPIRTGARINVWITVGTLLLLVLICQVAPLQRTVDWEMPRFDGVGRALVPVFWAYTGWNVVAVIAGECKEPHKVVPRAMVFGTLLVLVLYVWFNYALFRAQSPEQLASVPNDLGVIQLSERILAPIGPVLVAVVALVAMTSSLIATALAGPRLTAAMAQRGDFFPALGSCKANTGVPQRAALAQGLIAGVLVLMGNAMQLLEWTTCVMLLFGFLTAIAQIRLRQRDYRSGDGRIFRDPLFPLPALIYGGICLWVLASQAQVQLVASVGCIVSGVPLYLVFRARGQIRTGHNAP